jgi:hypothetical protein
MNNYDEPLEISAPIAWDLAARNPQHRCTRTAAQGADIGQL